MQDRITIPRQAARRLILMLGYELSDRFESCGGLCAEKRRLLDILTTAEKQTEIQNTTKEEV